MRCDISIVQIALSLPDVVAFWIMETHSHSVRSEEVDLKGHATVVRFTRVYSSRQPIKHHGLTAAPQIEDISASKTCIIQVY